MDSRAVCYFRTSPNVLALPMCCRMGTDEEFTSGKQIETKAGGTQAGPIIPNEVSSSFRTPGFDSLSRFFPVNELRERWDNGDYPQE